MYVGIKRVHLIASLLLFRLRQHDGALLPPPLPLVFQCAQGLWVVRQSTALRLLLLLFPCLRQLRGIIVILFTYISLSLTTIKSTVRLNMAARGVFVVVVV